MESGDQLTILTFEEQTILFHVRSPAAYPPTAASALPPLRMALLGLPLPLFLSFGHCCMLRTPPVLFIPACLQPVAAEVIRSFHEQAIHKTWIKVYYRCLIGLT
jgi:hypothetical protein